MERRRTISIPGTRRITLKDVAGLAGVSISTASLVLSGRASERRISPEVEGRVREIAQKQGYVPNLLVHSLQKGRTGVLSFYNAFRSRALNDLYMNRVSAAVEFAAAEFGYDLLIHRAGGRTADEVFRLLVGGFSDGVLFFGPPEGSELLDKLRESHLPTVLFNHADPANQLPFVCDDWQDGTRQIAERLVAAGHRRIAALDGFPGSDGRRRIAAFRQALEMHHVTISASRILEVYEGFRTPDEGLQLLMQNAAQEAPTAIFCWHDRLGYEVLEAAERQGISIPGDLSLVGYDGLHWPSISPHVLTSIQVPLEDAARKAIQTLDAHLAGRDGGATEEWYPVYLSEGTTLRALS